MVEPAATTNGSLSPALRDAVRQAHQSLIDAETRASRRAVVSRFRHRLRTDPGTLTSDDFLALADPAILQTAIVVAAQGLARADACDLQIYDAKTATLRLVTHFGFAPVFLEYFATVDAGVPSACGLALTTGDRVLVDNVARSRVFACRRTREVLLAAGSRAVQTYPLFDEHGSLLGMLSTHYRRPGIRADQQALASAAATAMTHLAAPSSP